SSHTCWMSAPRALPSLVGCTPCLPAGVRGASAPSPGRRRRGGRAWAAPGSIRSPSAPRSRGPAVRRRTTGASASPSRLHRRISVRIALFHPVPSSRSGGVMSFAGRIARAPGRRILMIAAAGRAAAPASSPGARAPPVAPRKPHVETMHGDTRSDDWFWLRDKTNPEVAQYLEAENAYAAQELAPLAGLQKTLYDEMLGRIQQTDLSVPYRERGFWYYTRTEEGKQYPIYCRRKGTMDAAEQVILDVNELARGHRY